jgi:hypothetical protein
MITPKSDTKRMDGNAIHLTLEKHPFNIGLMIESDLSQRLPNPIALADSPADLPDAGYIYCSISKLNHTY